MGILWHLVQIREDELDMIPVLHCQSVQLVRDENFDGRKEIRISTANETRAEGVR